MSVRYQQSGSLLFDIANIKLFNVRGHPAGLSRPLDGFMFRSGTIKMADLQLVQSCAAMLPDMALVAQDELNGPATIEMTDLG